MTTPISEYPENRRWRERRRRFRKHQLRKRKLRKETVAWCESLDEEAKGART